MRALFIAAALAACSSAPATMPVAAAPARTEAAGASCTDREAAARKIVESAIGDNLSCAADADCTVLGIATDCFDACSTAVSVKGADAVKAAITAANAQQCKTFASDGCKREIPPCRPPLAARCEAGKCTM